jgi:hypothetical protein
MKKSLLLAKTFFGRFFENDLMPPGLPQAQLVIWGLAFLAMPGLLLPTRLAAKYMILERNGLPVAHALLADRLIFITITMTSMGLVALIIWDGMFPDRRDARILAALPLPGWIPILGRLLALGALAGILLGGINFVPTLIYGPTVARYGGASNVFQGAGAHFLSTACAGMFVFSSLVALQGLGLNVGGRRAAERLSVLLQVIFVIALLQLVFSMMRVSAMLPADLRAPWLYAVPSVWFLGLNDVLGGRPVAGAASLGALAALATAVSIGAAVGLFAGTHARLTRLALESRELPRRRTGFYTLKALTERLTFRPAAKAVFDFTLHTVARSRSHRLLLSTYVGVGLALVASTIAPRVIRLGVAALAVPEVETVSAPLVITFAALIGMRVALAIPVEPRANWVIRLHEPVDRTAVLNGVRAAMLAIGVIPTSVLAFASAGFLWGLQTAFVHAFVVFVMGWLLIEILLLGLAKIPFTCTYFPGKSRIRTLWPLYVSGFVNYAYTTAAIELALFQSPRGLIIFSTIVGLAIAVLFLSRQRWIRSLQGFRFQEEDPDAMFEGFHLSEGLAARSREHLKP